MDSTDDTKTDLAAQLTRSIVSSTSNPSSHRKLSQLSAKVRSRLDVDTNGSARKEWNEVSSSIKGLAKVARVRVHDDLANALEKNLKQLNDHKNVREIWDETIPIKMDNLPQHVCLLLKLAQRPTKQIHEVAYEYLRRLPIPGPTPEQILFRQIMEENPFDPGEVWDEEVKHGWTESEAEDSTSDNEESPFEEEVQTPSSLILRRDRKNQEAERRDQNAREEAKRAIEELTRLKRGYWIQQKEIQDMDIALYGWKDIITKNSNAAIAYEIFKSTTSTDRPKVISASEFQRELLYALSGRPGLFFIFDSKGYCRTAPKHPQVQSFSPKTLQGILNKFKSHAALASGIRHFVSSTLQSCNDHICSDRAKQAFNKTQCAFAEACRDIMERYDSWLSDHEAHCTIGTACTQSSELFHIAATPLILNHEVEKTQVPLLRILAAFIPHSHSPTLLLNLIYTSITSFLVTDDHQNLQTLHHVFRLTAQPTWKILGAWIEQGMPLSPSLTDPETAAFSLFPPDIAKEERALDPEFFIKRDKDVSWVDEDFWECGYVVNQEGWPMWIGDEMGELIMETGKARGLLKGLLGCSNVGTDIEWLTLGEVLSASLLDDLPIPCDEWKDINESINRYLTPKCQLVLFKLRKMIDEECGLKQHLDAIEGTMFLRGHEVIQDWTDKLFRKVHKGEKWMDFQVLTNTLRDAIDQRQAGWMNPMALHVMTIRPQEAYLGPRILSTVRINYQVPFPLSQLLTPTTVGYRSEVFSFLVQLCMGRFILVETKHMDKELLKQCHTNTEGKELQFLCRIRNKILWLLNTIYFWLTMQVIESQTIEFRAKLDKVASLRSIIKLELEHTRTLQDCCFLNPSSSDLLEHIQIILNQCGPVSDCFTQWTSRPALTQTTPQFVTKRRRPARLQPPQIDDPHIAHERIAKKSQGEELPDNIMLCRRLERIKEKLNQSVSILKEGVETLSMGNHGELWTMLSFGLDEW
ncbi:uncharacterized protein L203_105645 [Cryptococcus depauperatus CBS 7841]|uniref:Spindle pole body component n=1 Tax=Cryptococcus depauperatus CBS 7841 TaxID=1295531 RepID=A0AAJ8JXZ6_9TREE